MDFMASDHVYWLLIAHALAINLGRLIMSGWQCRAKCKRTHTDAALGKFLLKPSTAQSSPSSPSFPCRLGPQRDTGTIGFGNARAVRNLYEQSITRQSARVLAEKRQGLSPDLLLLTRDDLLGPKHLDVTQSKPLQQLQGLRGLHKVKDSVATLLELIKTNAELEEVEQPLKDVCLNRVFLGNPGTGERGLHRLT
jgi:hypothetical protein